MRSLATRVREDEQMDDASLEPNDYASVLNDLERVNAWTFAPVRPSISSPAARGA